jgi:glyoxylase-like metal-dependent hydrolase (beta-lactamase superfamily II)
VEVIELHPDLHMLGCPVGHVYLWHGGDGLTLIDSSVPGTAHQIAAAIQTLGYRRHQQRRLLLTHWHHDHVGSAAEIAAWGDLSVYAHRADAPVIRGEQAGAPPTLADWERPPFDQVRTQLPSR